MRRSRKLWVGEGVEVRGGKVDKRGEGTWGKCGRENVEGEVMGSRGRAGK